MNKSHNLFGLMTFLRFLPNQFHMAAEVGLGGGGGLEGKGRVSALKKHIQ